jgi:hypothetical protein
MNASSIEVSNNNEIVLVDVRQAADALLVWLLDRCSQEHHFLESIVRDGFRGVEMMTQHDLAHWFALARVADYEWFCNCANKGFVR